MNPEEITRLRLECFRVALQVPANQKEYSSPSFNQQPPLPHSKTTAEILKEAEAIYSWIQSEKQAQ